MACCGRGAQKQLRDFAAGDLPDLEGFPHDGRLDDKLYERISQVVRPTHVERDSASVNLENHTSSHQTPRLRRLSTSRAQLFETGTSAQIPDSIAEDTASTSEQSHQSPQIQRSATATALRWTPSRIGLESAINAEKATSKAEPNPDLLQDETRLHKRLEKLRLDMHVVRGDGNCQFRALSFALYGTEDYYRQIREKSVKHMREHREEYEGFLGEDVDTYWQNMMKGGCWGDELTLRAVTDSLGIVVNVLTSDQHNWFMRYKPKELLSPTEAFITYISPVHYNAIRRRPGTAMFRRLSRSGSQIQAALDTARSTGSMDSGRESSWQAIPVV